MSRIVSHHNCFDLNLLAWAIKSPERELSSLPAYIPFETIANWVNLSGGWQSAKCDQLPLLIHEQVARKVPETRTNASERLVDGTNCGPPHPGVVPCPVCLQERGYLCRNLIDLVSPQSYAWRLGVELPSLQARARSEQWLGRHPPAPQLSVDTRRVWA